MKERPILFCTALVPEILADRKTQTRRLIREPRSWWEGYREVRPDPIRGFIWSIDPARPEPARWPPYGQPGDRLWVRESWWQDVSGGLAAYAADCHPKGPDNTACRLRPSIHMPRWASRLTLEIVTISAQRLQETTEEDAIAEGISRVRFRPDDGFPICDGFMVGKDDGKSTLYPTAREAFQRTWDDINAKRAPWDSNPWVWRIEFKRVRGEA